MRYGIIVAVVFMVGSAHASADGRIYAGVLFSAHGDEGYRRDGEDHGYNAVHPFIGYHHSSGFAAYALQNSYGDVAASVGFRGSVDVSRSLEVEGYIGPAFNYYKTIAIGWVGLNLYPFSDDRYSVHMRVSGGYIAGGVAFRW